MRRFSWFVLVKCVDYPIRMRHFSSRAIALGANFANKEIGRFTKSGSSMEEEKHKKPLLSYEEVIEVISRDEPATADERIKRVEEVAEQMEEERKKGISCRKKVSRFFRRSLINLDRSIRRCFGK
jgi:hypothetical protein